MPSSAAETQAATPETKPTPQPLTAAQRDSHDKICDSYLADKGALEQAQENAKDSKNRVMDFTRQHGTIPPDAEKSRSVQGNLYVSMVTTPNTISVNQSGAAKLESVLAGKEIPMLFAQLFARETVYTAVTGSGDALNSYLATSDHSAAERTRILALYAQCFDIGDRAPTLKVENLHTIRQREEEQKEKAARKAAKQSGRKVRA